MYQSWSTPPRLGPARRVAASSPRVQGWYNCVSAQRGAECCLNINKLSHSRETPALVTTLTRNTSPPAAAGGFFDQHFIFTTLWFWLLNIGSYNYWASMLDAQSRKAQLFFIIIPTFLTPARLCSALYDSCNSI